MGPKKKVAKKAVSSSKSSGTSSKKQRDLPPCAGYLISCDVPTKEYIKYLNELKPVDKKFILEDLDSRHLLVKRSVFRLHFLVIWKKSIRYILNPFYCYHYYCYYYYVTILSLFCCCYYHDVMPLTKAREEIERKVEAWMDENVFSAVERVGENLDMS